MQEIAGLRQVQATCLGHQNSQPQDEAAGFQNSVLRTPAHSSVDSRTAAHSPADTCMETLDRRGDRYNRDTRGTMKIPLAVAVQRHRQKAPLKCSVAVVELVDSLAEVPPRRRDSAHSPAPPHCHSAGKTDSPRVASHFSFLAA